MILWNKAQLYYMTDNKITWLIYKVLKSHCSENLSASQNFTNSFVILLVIPLYLYINVMTDKQKK